MTTALGRTARGDSAPTKMNRMDHLSWMRNIFNTDRPKPFAGRRNISAQIDQGVYRMAFCEKT